MSWIDTVPKVINGVTPFNAQGINPIIQALEDRTNFLKQQIVTEDIINGVGFTDIGFTGCTKGQFVAYNTKTNMYVPASCIWNITKNIPADSCYVVGLLVSDVIDDQGTVLASGIVRNDSIIAKILGSNAHIPGNYYLTTEGKVTHNTTNLDFAVRCGLLTASGCFVIDVQTPDFRTHNHTRYDLDPALWVSVDDLPENITPPDNAIKYYNTDKDNSISTVLRTFISTGTIIVNNNVLLSPVDYEIADGYIWLKHELANADSIYGSLFTTNPVVGVTQSIKGITSADNNNILKISQAGDIAVVDTSFPVLDTNCRDGKAVMRIDNNGISTGDIVQEIQAGAGVTVTKGDKGVVRIDRTDAVEAKIELNILNSNGAVFSGSDILLLKFPKGRTSSVHGTARLPVTTAQAAKIFMWVQGNGSSTPQGNVQLKQVDLSSDNFAVIPNVPTTLSFLPKDTVDTNGVYYWETSMAFEPVSGGFVNVIIEFTDAPTTVNVCSIGIVLL